MKNIVFIFLIASLLAKEAVVELTPSDFDSVVDGSKNVFVEFYAPWCGHCKSFAPDYENIGKAFQNFKNEVVIAKVDADKHKELAGRFDVSGFPTLKFFPKGSTSPEEYSEARTADAVIQFINGKAGTSARIVEQASAVVTLTTANFDKIVLNSNKDVLVEFYAPWCGHCKNLKPVYDELGKAFEGEESVVIAKVDATAEPDLGSKYDVKGYPTIKWFSKGNVEPYNGGRSLKDFVDFINEKSGTFRNEDGSLSENAGRIDVLDKYASDFYHNEDDRDNVIKQTESVCSKGTYTEEQCKPYLSTMKKIIEKGKDFINTEKTRLHKLINSEGIQPSKRDNFRKKLNILQGFLHKSEPKDEIKEDEIKEDL